jgi:hypothetical protein
MPFHRAKGVQQSAFARWSDATDLVEWILAHLRRSFGPVRADGEPMGLITEPLDEIEHRVARLQHEGLALHRVQRFTAGIAP